MAYGSKRERYPKQDKPLLEYVLDPETGHIEKRKYDHWIQSECNYAENRFSIFHFEIDHNKTRMVREYEMNKVFKKRIIGFNITLKQARKMFYEYHVEKIRKMEQDIIKLKDLQTKIKATGGEK